MAVADINPEIYSYTPDQTVPGTTLVRRGCVQVCNVCVVGNMKGVMYIYVWFIDGVCVASVRLSLWTCEFIFIFLSAAAAAVVVFVLILLFLLPSVSVCVHV